MTLFRFCPHCAAPLERFLDDDAERARCSACGFVHYRNPTVGAAVVIVEEGRLLLGRRRSGGWCIPCGHVEWDEAIERAALREFTEETGLTAELLGVFAVESNFHNPKQHTVGVWYRGRRIGGELRCGGDLVAVEFFPLEELPELIFPTDRKVVERLKSGEEILQ